MHPSINRGAARLSTKNFTFDRASGTFIAEMSDFREARIANIFLDACDVGFWLVSHKTGHEIPFVLTHHETSGEGELLFDIFTPVPGTAPRGIAPLRVQLFND